LARCARGWQGSEFLFIASEQDSLAFFFAETVGHLAVAAFAAVDAIIVTSELAPPALQGGEP
jgi:hypothetical protein